MRLFSLALALLVALTTVARADDEDDAFVPMPKRSIGLTLLGHGTRIDGRSEGGFGPALDLAIGRGRWQYFGEAGLASASMSSWTTSAVDMHVDGRMVHGGLGVRWIARQMRDEDKVGGVEMFLLSLLGMQRYYMDDGMRLTRPEVALGFGLQARLFKRPRLGFRFDMRLLFTPSSKDDSNPGFMGGLGFAW